MGFLTDGKVNGADLLSYLVGAGLLLYGLRRLQKRPWAGKPAKYIHEPSSDHREVIVGMDPAGPSMSFWHRHSDKSERGAELALYAWVYGDDLTIVSNTEDQAKRVFQRARSIIDAENVDVAKPYDWHDDDS